MKFFNKIIALLMCLLCLGMSACSRSLLQEHTDSIQLHQIALDTAPDYVLEQSDSHGGFLGDGVLFVKAAYTAESSKAVEAQIRNSSYWKQLPGFGTVAEVLYGDNWNSLVSVVDAQDSLLSVPPITNGAYCYYDRRADLPSGQSRYDEGLLLDGSYSFDFTLAVYDFDTQLFYYIETDT